MKRSESITFDYHKKKKKRDQRVVRVILANAGLSNSNLEFGLLASSNKFIMKNAWREDYYAISSTQHRKLEYELD